LFELMMLEPGVEATSKQKENIRNKSLYIIGFSAAFFVTMYLYIGLFLASGEKLAIRLRQGFYRALLRQNIAFYDRKENMVGKVTTRLASDPTTMKGISGERIGNIVNTCSSVGFGIGIGFYYQWKVALCVLAVTPILVIVVFMHGKLSAIRANPATAAYEESGITLVEAV